MNVSIDYSRTCGHVMQEAEQQQKPPNRLVTILVADTRYRVPLLPPIGWCEGLCVMQRAARHDVFSSESWLTLERIHVHACSRPWLLAMLPARTAKLFTGQWCAMMTTLTSGTKQPLPSPKLHFVGLA